MSEQANGLPSTELQRVKVYRLNSEGHWDDKGQGQVTIAFLEVRACRLPGSPPNSTAQDIWPACSFGSPVCGVTIAGRTQQRSVHMAVGPPRGWASSADSDRARHAQASQSPGIVVISEEDLDKTLLIHKLSKHNNYQQSGGACCSCGALFTPPAHADGAAGAEDTIITWTDTDIGVDVALSFQEAEGCSSIWCAHPWPLAGPLAVSSMSVLRADQATSRRQTG